MESIKYFDYREWFFFWHILKTNEFILILHWVNCKSGKQHVHILHSHSDYTCLTSCLLPPPHLSSYSSSSLFLFFWKDNFFFTNLFVRNFLQTNILKWYVNVFSMWEACNCLRTCVYHMLKWHTSLLEIICRKLMSFLLFILLWRVSLPPPQFGHLPHGHPIAQGGDTMPWTNWGGLVTLHNGTTICKGGTTL